MVKRSKKRKERQEPLDHTELRKHKRHGKKLSPPLATLPKMQPSSWLDDWLPEMLWAALLISGLGRERALDIFRRVGRFIFDIETKDKPYDVTHTGLARMGEDILLDVLSIIVESRDAEKSLCSLLLLEDLPAIQHWRNAIGQEPASDDWNQLAEAVALTLYHQSQEATDCRWLRLLCLSAAGKLRLPSEDLVKGLLYYPNYGDMTKVRPFIRASEMAFRNLNEEDGQSQRVWPRLFWDQCFSDTECIPLSTVLHLGEPVIGTTGDRVNEVYELLVEHTHETASTTATDSKHDTVFGIGLYSLSILKELLRIGASQLISARLALRTLLEAYVTLAYLVQNDDPELWKTYRVYGAGQAKLSYLKLEEADDTPQYVEVEMLKQLANEDIWEEFLSIDLGHWEKSNLRQLGIKSGTKEDYDAYYPWPSNFVHAQWGALRDTVFDFCGNPLHRLHRIPRRTARALPDVVPDACILVDKILELVASAFPEFDHRVKVSASDLT